jgi:hypothetical protein|nr:MAG TPA: hypothetical protein [Caudoviricetes sp.]
MKEFNLEAALNGEPVMLQSGVFGKGIQDIPNAQRDPIYKKAYSRWYNLLQRCYSSNFHKNHPTYARASICEDWLVFSNFYYWITSFDNWENLELDKDLLSGAYYSPETCLLLPKNLNTFLTFSQKTNTNMIGVNYYTPKGQKEGVFRATISVKFKGGHSNKHLGHFATPLEGHLAWLSAKVEQLDEYILKSDGKVKLTLLSLKECMKYFLANKKEFYGLECFREWLSQKGMWEEPKKQISIEDLPKPFKPQTTQHYYYIDGGNIESEDEYWESNSFDRNAAMNGNCFRTREDAQKWLDFMKSMME